MPCNTQWMSRLENDCKPFLAPMMHGKKSSLTSEQHELIVRWFLKIAMMLEFKGDTSVPRYFTTEERLALCKQGTIPEGILVSSACRAKTRDTHHFSATRLEIDNDGESLYAYAATMSIKQLALQLCFVREFKRIVDFSWPPIFPPLWNDAVIDIWPSPGTITWPPKAMLDLTMFEIFPLDGAVGFDNLCLDIPAFPAEKSKRP